MNDPQILDNPYWRDRVSEILVTNSTTLMPNTRGVAIRVHGKEENAVLLYPLIVPYRAPAKTLEDYLEFEWYDTHDEGRSFVPCERPVIEKFLKAFATNG